MTNRKAERVYRTAAAVSADTETSKRAAMEREETRRKTMSELCLGYKKEPIHRLTDEEAVKMSGRLAHNAAKTLGLSREEKRQYAAAIAGSIMYFNKRDAVHTDVMRYRRECEKAPGEDTGEDQPRIIVM